MKTINLQIAMMILSITMYAQNQMVNSGNLKIYSSGKITFFGDLINNGTFDDGGQVVEFNGTVNQKISGSSGLTITNLVVNNPSGVTMERSVTISNSLTLTSGVLDLNSNTLTINNNSPSSLTRTNGYILSEKVDNSGKLKWNIGSNIGAYTFPFGTVSGEYIPFVLNLTSGDIGNVIVSTFPTANDNTPYPTSPDLVTNMNDGSGNNNSNNVVDRFWQINKDGSSGTATLTFTAAAIEIGSVGNLQAQRWNPTINIWEAPLSGQTNTANSATVPVVTNFSVWALSGNMAPLPVELVSFIASKDKNHVHLNWKTLSEINNDYFTIEKSNDGLEYEKVSIIDGSGNSNHELSYSTTDTEPYEGLSYYRLKQTDFDGKFSYSKIQAVDFNLSPEFYLNVYPNPTTSDNINLQIVNAKDESIQINISDMLGKEVYSNSILITENNQNITLLNNEYIISGLCLLSVTLKGTHIVNKLMIN